MKKLPATIGELITELDNMYPPKCIGQDDTLRDADRYAGKRSLVDELQLRWGSTEKHGLKDALLK